MPTGDAVQGETAPDAEASSTDPLDNPIWNALITEHADFALGGDKARRYPEDIGPLSGMPTQSEEGYRALEPLVGPSGVMVLFLREEPRLPAGWTLVRRGVLHQMVALRPTLAPALAPGGVQLRQLTPEDAPPMVDLARLTEPGPFRQRTIELGTFLGIVQSGRLLAMAGQRLRLPGFVEVSAVCTHPDARGRGYARLLMSCVMSEIVQAGKTPFLHTFADNFGAIRVYEGLGFTFRQSFEMAALKRAA